MLALPIDAIYETTCGSLRLGKSRQRSATIEKRVAHHQNGNPTRFCLSLSLSSNLSIHPSFHLYLSEIAGFPLLSVRFEAFRYSNSLVRRVRFS